MPDIGQTISHYKIVEKIGRGGMGEVYLAEDLSLDREVALKFLPDVFTGDPERMARFEREAKLLAALNHANIAAIYGLEQAEGKRFLIMEYVEGETLQARLSKGALPLEDALALCRQIAEGLEAAHEKGVIHRDLKPANVMITAEEKVKILDFGLAKAFSDDIQSIDSSQSPTLTEAMTRPGVILGTAAYMSPEQAKGKSVDKRADIWAFGCVLYECLTGKRPFEGETITETLAAVIKEEPDWNRLPPNLHSRIRLLLERCLEKNPKKRYSGVNDAWVDIDKALSDPSGLFVQPVTYIKPEKKLRVGLPLLVAIVVTAILITGMLVWRLKPIGSRQLAQFYFELPESQNFGELTERAFAISPDGNQLVCKTDKGLLLRSIDELNARLIPGTEDNPQKPFFSPDGQWVGYVSANDGQLKKISINGGTPVPLMDHDSAGFLSWSKDDTILFANGGRIMKISANGGDPELLVDAKEGFCFAPQILPDGESVLFTFGPPPFKVMVQSLDSDKPKELFPGDTAQYLPTGHIIYGIRSSIYVVPFNLKRLEVSGKSIPFIKGVVRVGGAPQYAISDTGTLVYMPDPRPEISVEVESSLVWVNRNGEEEPLSAPANDYRDVRISPDGKQLALAIYGADQNRDIWTWDLARETSNRITFDEADDNNSIWTPDGQRIVFTSNRNGYGGIYWKAADGTGEVEQLVAVPDRRFLPTSWSDDGKSLVFHESITSPFQIDIGMLDMEGARERRVLLREEYNEFNPRLSNDGRWIAYASDESGQVEIWVRPFPEVNKGRWQVTKSGGNSPLWAPDGRELYYWSNDNVMAISVESETIPKFGKPEVLFRGTYSGSDWLGIVQVPRWDISLDGKRFLMIKPVWDNSETGEGIPRKINIILNWFEELKQKVPVP
jgi:serine/threonine protein kinase